PDGGRLAYVPYSNGGFIPDPRFHMAWKRYRGGTTSPIWIADLADSHVEKIPRKNSNDSHPMWVGSKIYFLSDRNGPVTLFVYEAHGEILTLPAEKGEIRDLTNTPAVAERDPAWSPDGKQIAYFSDESGEYQLHLRDQKGRGKVKKVALGDPPSFYYAPTWS